MQFETELLQINESSVLALIFKTELTPILPTYYPILPKLPGGCSSYVALGRHKPTHPEATTAQYLHPRHRTFATGSLFRLGNGMGFNFLIFG